MNPLPPNADELVSAYLDGEATPDEVVTVESHPDLRSRVEELRALSGPLAMSPTAPSAQKEAHLSAAMDLFDELFADSPGAAASLAAVPAAPPAAAAETDPAAPVDEMPPVVSLGAARERRRPRRFNMGVIAAATAALLLFVGLAALSFGRASSDDVATSSDDSVESAEAMAADESDSFAVDADNGDGSSAGLSQSESSRSIEPPAATAQAPMDDTEFESAADEAPATMEAADTAGAASGSADMDQFATDATEDAVDDAQAPSAEAAPLTYDLVLGEFVDNEALRQELEQFTAQEWRQRAELLDAGLFPGCQQEVPDLAKADQVSLVGEAMVDGRRVEIHILSADDQDLSLLVLDPLNNCTILSTIP